MNEPVTFALYFGNRGFFPESLIAAARVEMEQALRQAGYGVLMMPADATPHGAVETAEEGRKYAAFLAAHAGAYDGVILCLPNFGDETGAIAALRDAGVPILVQAYPDELDKMGFANRRDAYCGKLSILDVFGQYGLAYTILPPHTVHPLDARFASHLDIFARTCRVVRDMRQMVVGAFGARTTPFKTVRFDELALQRCGVTTETFDLSEVLARARELTISGEPCREKARRLKAYTRWDAVPAEAFEQHVRLSVVLDTMAAEARLDALALRCWIELEKEMGISPCVVLGELNDRGMPAACELDVCNAVAMRALVSASGTPATCLDWNNNYGEDGDKVILFHCGPVPQSLMIDAGEVIDHPMFAKALGAGHGFGCNVGRIRPTPMTYASARTDQGRLSFFLGQGQFTADPIPAEFFGCAGVAHIADLQRKLTGMARKGYRHHVSVCAGHVAAALGEAFGQYLPYDVDAI